MKVGLYLLFIVGMIGGLLLSSVALLSVIEGEIRGFIALPFYTAGTIGMGFYAVKTYREEFVDSAVKEN